MPKTRNVNRIAIFAVLALLAVLLNASVQAQIGANVGGIVTDNSGAVLPGVTITITNTATGRTRSLVTSADGRYRAVALEPGPYQIVAELQGNLSLEELRAQVRFAGTAGCQKVGADSEALAELAEDLKRRNPSACLDP